MILMMFIYLITFSILTESLFICLTITFLKIFHNSEYFSYLTISFLSTEAKSIIMNDDKARIWKGAVIAYSRY